VPNVPLGEWYFRAQISLNLRLFDYDPIFFDDALGHPLFEFGQLSPEHLPYFLLPSEFFIT
jgi:hypothetical protein